MAMFQRAVAVGGVFASGQHFVRGAVPAVAANGIKAIGGTGISTEAILLGVSDKKEKFASRRLAVSVHREGGYVADFVFGETRHLCVVIVNVDPAGSAVVREVKAVGNHRGGAGQTGRRHRCHCCKKQ